MKIAAEVHLSTSSPQQRGSELVGIEERKSIFSGIFNLLGLSGHLPRMTRGMVDCLRLNFPMARSTKTELQNRQPSSLEALKVKRLLLRS